MQNKKTVEQMAEAAIPDITEERRKELGWTNNELSQFQDGFHDGFIAGYRSQPTGWVRVDKESDLPDEKEFGYCIKLLDEKSINHKIFYTQGGIEYMKGQIGRYDVFYLSEPGELPGVEECMDNIHWTSRNNTGKYFIDEETMNEFITFCQTPKQG